MGICGKVRGRGRWKKKGGGGGGGGGSEYGVY